MLPAGKYTVTGSMYVTNSSASLKVDTSCTLDSPADTDPDHEGNAALSLMFAANTTYGTLTAQTVLNLPSAGTATISCQKFGTGSASFYQARVLATKVETLN